MLAPERLDRIHVALDDHRLVANAGLIPPVTLAHHPGLRELVDRHVDLGDALGRANGGDKLLTLVASALAGGDCIDDADALRVPSKCWAVRSRRLGVSLPPSPVNCLRYTEPPAVESVTWNLSSSTTTIELPTCKSVPV